tara:strand:+ start:8201 stop:8725 length:525 start_codon:yes stop_codon:yes gene_type:complete
MLPAFTYHPQPIETGAIKASDAKCECCSKARGFIYTASLYCADEVESVCPWCIADGSAAEKFDGMFSDDYPLVDAGLDPEIIDEVTKRTPGFSSWQQEVWLSCCSDACEFHGDASKADVSAMTLEVFRSTFDDSRLTEEFFTEFKQNYSPGGNPAIYKWKCRKCSKVLYYADYT